jgi:hypothetical protein
MDLQITEAEGERIFGWQEEPSPQPQESGNRGL